MIEPKTATERKTFPSELQTALVAISTADDMDDIASISCESTAWSDTSMGFGGMAGQMITPGWVVTIRRYPHTEIWHVSALGGVRLRRIEERP